MNTSGPQINGPTGFWRQFGNFLTGGSPSTPDQKFGTLNDFDLIFIRNAIEAGRFNTNGLLIGPTSSGNAAARIQISGTLSGTRIFKYFVVPATPVLNAMRLVRAETNGAVLTSVNLTTVPDQVHTMRFVVTAKQVAGSTGAVGDMASIIKTASFSNVGGVMTKLFEQTDYSYKVDAGLDFTLTIAGNDVVLNFQGVANRDMIWGAREESDSVTT